MDYEYFNSQKGWIQFVFANEQDIYDLPSTVRVGFHKYLEYLLKQSGYEAIFFWEEINGQTIFSFPDENSAAIYEQIRPKKWSFFGGDTGKTSMNPKVSRETVEAIISAMGNSDKRIALVTSMKTFDAFYSDEASIKRLKKSASKQHSANSILLLTAGIIASDSNAYLAKPNGVLQAMLEEVKQAASPSNSLDLYSALKKNMHERCVFLNDLSRNRIKNTVKRNVMQMSITLDANYTDSVNAATEIIYKYYHSEAFRESFADLVKLPANERYEMRKIDERLRDPKFFESIESIASRYQSINKKNAVNQYEVCRISIEQTYSDDIDICYICENEFALNRWLEMSKTIKRLDSDHVNNAEEIKDIGKIDRMLRNIVLRGGVLAENDDGTNPVKESIQYCIDSIEKSGSKEWQRDYRKQKIFAFKSYLGTVGTADSAEEWKLYKLILDSAENAQVLKGKMRESMENAKQAHNELQKVNDKLKNEPQGTYAWNRYIGNQKSITSRFNFYMNLHEKLDKLEKSFQSMVERAKQNVSLRVLKKIGIEDINESVIMLRDEELRIKEEANELLHSSKLDENSFGYDYDGGMSHYGDYLMQNDGGMSTSDDRFDISFDDIEETTSGYNHDFFDEELDEWMKKNGD